MYTKPAEQRWSHRHHHHHHHRHIKFHILTTLCFTAIFFTYMLNRNIFISNISFNFNPKSTIPIPSNQLKSTSTIQNPILIVKEFIIQESQSDQFLQNQNPLFPPVNLTTDERFDILNSNQEFETRADEFFKDCKFRFFMTWISSNFKFFGEREFLALDALFQSNPNSCLMILSNTMDSDYGFQILKPVIDLGFQVLPIQPDFNFLFHNTPAKTWFDHIKNGNLDPGEIPLAQNLSNLIRLVVLYKYGGVYLDTDFIPLKDFTRLRNSIGAQTANRFGNWTRLNNAVLIFDKNHPLLNNFIEEFALTFDGNRWGQNGPYLVSRVAERGARKTDLNFNVLPPAAFYPVDWTRIGGLFRRPVNRADSRWAVAKVVQLEESSYGVHLWNKKSRRLRIEEESIMARLISKHCVVCKIFNTSQRTFGN